MRLLVAILAVIVIAVPLGSASSQTLTPRTTPEAYFCSLCKIQECSCSGGQCVNCKGSGFTANPTNDARVTRQVCIEARGQFRRGLCITRQ
jgi:hypothetical protein